jgi:hypothetical protein
MMRYDDEGKKDSPIKVAGNSILSQLAKSDGTYCVIDAPSHRSFDALVNAGVPPRNIYTINKSKSVLEEVYKRGGRGFPGISTQVIKKMNGKEFDGIYLDYCGTPDTSKDHKFSPQVDVWWAAANLSPDGYLLLTFSRRCSDSILKANALIPASMTLVYEKKYFERCSMYLMVLCPRQNQCLRYMCEQIYDKQSTAPVETVKIEEIKETEPVEIKETEPVEIEETEPVEIEETEPVETSFSKFLKENLEYSPGKSMSAKSLVKYINSTSHMSLSLQLFGKMARELGYEWGRAKGTRIIKCGGEWQTSASKTQCLAIRNVTMRKLAVLTMSPKKEVQSNVPVPKYGVGDIVAVRYFRDSSRTSTVCLNARVTRVKPTADRSSFKYSCFFIDKKHGWSLLREDNIDCIVARARIVPACEKAQKNAENTIMLLFKFDEKKTISLSEVSNIHTRLTGKLIATLRLALSQRNRKDLSAIRVLKSREAFMSVIRNILKKKNMAIRFQKGLYRLRPII